MADLRSGPARLLVADDNKVNRLLLTRNLELQGHSVASAENGRVALEMLRRERFDLLLLDMEMPEVDGFQVLEQMKNDLALRDIAVIVTSSLEGIDHVVRCIELGAEDYLPKPVNPVLLKARIGASLEKKRLRDQQKELVRRFAAPEVAQDLQDSGFTLGGKRVDASVLFCDIRGFTTLAESQPPEETIELLNTYYALMFDAISGHGGIVTMMMGDGLMAVFGAPLPLPDHGRSAVDAAREMIELVELFNVERKALGKAPIGDRHRHRVGRDGGGLCGDQPARRLHVHRRHRQPGRAARAAHEARVEAAPDRPRDARAAGRAGGRRAARPRAVQGQDGRRRRLRGSLPGKALTGGGRGNRRQCGCRIPAFSSPIAQERPPRSSSAIACPVTGRLSR